MDWISNLPKVNTTELRVLIHKSSKIVKQGAKLEIRFFKVNFKRQFQLDNIPAEKLSSQYSAMPLLRSPRVSKSLPPYTFLDLFA